MKKILIGIAALAGCVTLNLNSASAEEEEPKPTVVTEEQFASVAKQAIQERTARLAAEQELRELKAKKTAPAPVAAASAPMSQDLMAAMEKRLDERDAKLLAALRAAVPPPPAPKSAMPGPRMVPSIGGVPLCDQSGLKMPGGMVNETQGYVDGPAPWHRMGVPTGGLGYRVESNMGEYAYSMSVNGRFLQPFAGGQATMTPVVHNGSVCLMPIVMPGMHTARFLLDDPGPQHFEFTAWSCVGNRSCRKVGTFTVDSNQPGPFPAVTALYESRFGL